MSFFTCIDCGKPAERKNPRQVRCPECQAVHRAISKKENAKKNRTRKTENKIPYCKDC